MIESTKNFPKISVIIPAYNSEKTIDHTIKSVLNQTFFDLSCYTNTRLTNQSIFLFQCWRKRQS